MLIGWKTVGKACCCSTYWSSVP